jgi:hypothetical protein
MRVPEEMYQQFCRSMPLACVDLGTYDVMLDDTEKGFTSHGVTTLFVIRADATAGTTLDAQSAACAWRTPDRWRQEPLHDFVLAGLSRLEASLG